MTSFENNVIDLGDHEVDAPSDLLPWESSDETFWVFVGPSLEGLAPAFVGLPGEPTS
jgi:hypothetical protein